MLANENKASSRHHDLLNFSEPNGYWLSLSIPRSDPDRGIFSRSVDESTEISVVVYVNGGEVIESF